MESTKASEDSSEAASVPRAPSNHEQGSRMTQALEPTIASTHPPASAARNQAWPQQHYQHKSALGLPAKTACVWHHSEPLLLADAECGENSLKNSFSRRGTGQRVERTQRGIQVEQKKFVGKRANQRLGGAS